MRTKTFEEAILKKIKDYLDKEEVNLPESLFTLPGQNKGDYRTINALIHDFTNVVYSIENILSPEQRRIVFKEIRLLKKLKTQGYYVIPYRSK